MSRKYWRNKVERNYKKRIEEEPSPCYFCHDVLCEMLGMGIKMDELIKYLPLLIPIALLQIGLQLAAIINLVRRNKVRFGNKYIWAIIILFGSLVGAIVYFILRGDEE